MVTIWGMDWSDRSLDVARAVKKILQKSRQEFLSSGTKVAAEGLGRSVGVNRHSGG